MTARSDIQNAASTTTSKRSNRSKGGAVKPDTNTTVTATAEAITIKDLVAKYPALKNMFNEIEIQWFEPTNRGDFSVAQVTLEKYSTIKGVKERTRVNWVKFGLMEGGLPFVLKKSYKDEKGNWTRAKRATVSGTKIDDDEKYTINRAVERAATDIINRAFIAVLSAR